MKLINIDMKGLNFNIGGKNHLACANGIIELDDKESAKILCETAGFKLLRNGKNLNVEPEPEAPLSDEEKADLEAEAELGLEAEVEAELPESDIVEAELPEIKEEVKPEVKSEPKASGKWLPGKNNKNK